MQKSATAATTPEPAKLLTTSDTRPGIFTVASSLECLETDSPYSPIRYFRSLISASQLFMRMQTAPSPSKTNPVWDCFRNSKPLFETQDLLEWPLSACRRRYRIGCRRSRGVPVTQTQSPTKSFKPQPTSKTCPSPAIPYSFVTCPNPLNSSDPNSRYSRLSSR